MLVSVDDSRLQRRVHLAEGHRGRTGSHQLDRLHINRRLDRSNLQACQLAWFGDIARSRDDLTEAERIAPRERPHANGAFQVISRLETDMAVDNAMDVIPIAPEEREVEDLEFRRDASPDGRTGHHEVNQPFLDLLNDFTLLPERAAREDADRDRIVRGLFRQRPEGVGKYMKGSGAGGHRMRQPKNDRPACLVRTARGGAQRRCAQGSYKGPAIDRPIHVPAHYGGKTKSANTRPSAPALIERT